MRWQGWKDLAGFGTVGPLVGIGLPRTEKPSGLAPCGCPEWYDEKRKTKVAGHEIGDALRAEGCTVRQGRRKR